MQLRVKPVSIRNLNYSVTVPVWDSVFVFQVCANNHSRAYHQRCDIISRSNREKGRSFCHPVECEKENRSITRWEKEYILMVRPREENLFLCFSNSKFQTPARKLNQYWHELNPVYITILNPDFPRTIELVPGNIQVGYFFFSRRANFCNPFFKRINSISSRRRELEGIIRAKSRGDGRKVGQE